MRDAGAPRGTEPVKAGIIPWEEGSRQSRRNRESSTESTFREERRALEIREGKCGVDLSGGGRTSRKRERTTYLPKHAFRFARFISSFSSVTTSGGAWGQAQWWPERVGTGDREVGSNSPMRGESKSTCKLEQPDAHSTRATSTRERRRRRVVSCRTGDTDVMSSFYRTHAAVNSDAISRQARSVEPPVPHSNTRCDTSRAPENAQKTLNPEICTGMLSRRTVHPSESISS